MGKYPTYHAFGNINPRDISMERIIISTVTPVYNGQETLPELVEELAKIRDSWKRDDLPLELAESVFVDDGSVDESAKVLAGLAEKYSWVQVVTLSKNFGQHPATAAGILHSSGDWVFTLDEDLQHHPRHLLTMLKAVVEGHGDILYVNPVGPVHQSGFRDYGSQGFKWLLSIASGNPNVRLFNSFRLLRGSVARAAAAVSSHDTFLDIVLGWYSDRIVSTPLFLNDTRYVDSSKSGYGLWRLLAHARRAIVSSQTKWLRLSTLLGTSAVVLSLLLATIVLFMKLADPSTVEVKGWTSLFLSVVFFGGLSSFLTGVILEYLSPILFKAQGKPTFFVVDRYRDALLAHALAKVSSDAAPVVSSAR